VMPVYPAPLREKGVGGKVTVAVTIDKHGRVAKADFNSGESKLADISARAVKQWRFNPYIWNAEPLEIKGFIALEFQPESGQVRFATTAPSKASDVQTPRVR
jgi:TonB family protein